jgi:hypothetical protein
VADESRNNARPRVWTGAAAWAIGVVHSSLDYWAFCFIPRITRALGLFDVLIILTCSCCCWSVGAGLFAIGCWPETTRCVGDGIACARDVWLWLNRLTIPLMLVMLLFGVRLFL